ncbi:hypothetical protein CCR94_16270 [Rhodoblastus sphagnicola]|uniref:DUF1565 domain-containing protein n=1 Tax=Rhodoblastus sphagnicola TaxID=333368 RepID=A0A2S6N2U1_9HYPH|nr:hypothetical protein [Rhodoblastus sphagnicola]MBB4199049.1 hypothetical protein [Rhodoblastus sphagnicola]PPQ28945.1 hypothetical protein CCR94_16270 [Rhodoblastus sphagnicola]
MALADNINAAAAALVAENTTLQALIAQFQSTIPAEALVADIIAGTADNLYISPAKFLAFLQAPGTNAVKQAISQTNTAPANAFFINPAIGSDSNPGTAATAPWKTTDHAASYLSQFSSPGLTLNIAAGTYDNLTLGASGISNWIVNCAGAGQTIFNTQSPTGFSVSAVNTNLSLSGCTIQSSAGSGLIADQSAVVHISNCNFGPTAANGQIDVNGAAALYLKGNVQASGASGWFADAAQGASIIFGGVGAPLALSYSGSSYAIANMCCGAAGTLSFASGYVTFNGTPTGKRFAIEFAELNTQGQGEYWIPGTIAGTNTNGLLK